jgi:hypothetical protein
MVPDWFHTWPRLAVQAFQGTKGRGLRLTLDPNGGPWFYLVPVSTTDRTRLAEESRRVPNNHGLRSW